jgi:oligo-1,6-glucosidase
MAYAFDGVDIAKPEGYSLLRFKEVFSRWDSAFANDGWLSVFLANHDQARMVSRFGNDSLAFRDLSSKMLTTFIFSMRGTAYYYNGDELGMTNAGFDKIEDYKDMPTLNEYQNQKNSGGDLNKFMQRIKFESRDNGRTPFQWNATTHAGFTTGTPWIKVNPNYKTLNAAAQEKDPNSCLNYFRNLVKLRKANPALVYGKYTLLDKNNPAVYAYTREEAGRKLLIVLNFSKTSSEANLGINVVNAKLLLNNYKDAPVNNISQSVIRLRPYEAVIYQL